MSAALPLGPVAAQSTVARPSLQNSFRLGTGGGALCQVQSRSIDPAIRGMFDRAYAIVCRDAATPIGRIYALRRAAGEDPAARLATLRADRVACGAPAAVSITDLAGATFSACQLSAGAVGYNVYAATRGRTTYVAEGLAGYDDALRLGLRTIVADRILPGEIAVATTGGGDPAAFARVQAGSLDIDQALAEGYRRNNSGSYAEAAEFFDTLLQRVGAGGANQRQLGEYVINRALQKSNLGDFAEADALFAQAARIPTSDPVQLRLRRNFHVLHLLNQRLLPDAVAELARPLAAADDGRAAPAAGEIDTTVAAELNSGVPLNRRLGVSDTVALTQEEKATILDAQAEQLRGTALRLQGDLPGARTALDNALARLVSVREGRVSSITRLRAQTLAELSAVAEAGDDQPRAETLLRESVALLATEYPQSAALNAAKARLAGFLGRRGQTPAALALYRDVVAAMTASGGATTGFENLLAPYFALLAREIPNQPALVDDFFLASETLVRPGVADTQAVLARELSGGSDEASRLFRQSVNLTRDIARNRVEYARLAALPSPTPEEDARTKAITATLATLEADQVATQAKLGQFPRYRAISTEAMRLADLRKALRPGEAYFKLAEIGDAVYAIYVSPTEATAYRAGIGAKALERKVDGLRDTISIVENDQPVTYPFDVKGARELYLALMQPVEARLTGVKHLLFEPDGAMLRLPANLLVIEQAGVDAYLKRVADPKADTFDFTSIRWLGRDIDVSTSLSARAFRDVRSAAPSAAKKEYLGLGQNQPVSPLVHLASTRSAPTQGGVDCDWPLAAWNNPIKATELKTAQAIIGAGAASVVTDADFTDTGLLARSDLDQYRILHFATHGLVTAPRPECPARPALLTSFGGAKSDGLLTFREIYDLRLDADIVILSACDTAGKATVAATREAGVTVGGGDALDGLVRAFIGAGGRSVLASHWPLPDDYGATERLISGLFTAKPGTSIADAIRAGQDILMAKPETSHPYYWAGFAIVGDGAQAVLTAQR
ncbi:MAG: CHAT domain-containing protein [Sphingomonas sp.]